MEYLLRCTSDINKTNGIQIHPSIEATSEAVTLKL